MPALYSGQFVATGVNEVETPAAGECKNWPDDLPARVHDSFQSRLKIINFDHRQGRFGRFGGIRLQSDIRIASSGRRIRRPEFSQRPSERRLIKCLGGFDVSNRQLDVVQAGHIESNQ